MADLNNVDATRSQFRESPPVDNKAPVGYPSSSPSSDKDRNIGAAPLENEPIGDLLEVYEKEGRTVESTSTYIENDAPKLSQQISGKLHFERL